MDRLDPIEVAALICFVALPLWGVVDAARLPKRAWEAAGRSKRFWIALQVLTLYLGAVAYLAGVRKDVRFFLAEPSPDWEEEE